MNEKKKFEFKGKKTLIICTLVLMIGVVGYLNYALANKDNKTKEELKEASSDASESIDVFAAYRDERAMTRTQEISYIDSVVSSSETDENIKTQAQEQKLALIANMEDELTIEGIITTKLETDAIVTVKDGAVNVVVNKKVLSDDEVSQIVEVVKTQTGQ